MTKAVRPPTTPHIAVVIPFPPRPASGSLLTPEMVQGAIEYAEKVPQDELLGSAALLLQWAEKLAKPGTGVQSIHGALMAFLCLARALDHVGVPVAEVVQ